MRLTKTILSFAVASAVRTVVTTALPIGEKKRKRGG